MRVKAIFQITMETNICVRIYHLFTSLVVRVS